MLRRKGDVDKALVLVNWPAGHFIFGGSSHHTHTKAVAMRYGLRVAAPSPHQEASGCLFHYVHSCDTHQRLDNRPPPD